MTGTLRTTLTSSLCFILEFCLCTFVCVPDKENLNAFFFDILDKYEVWLQKYSITLVLYIGLLFWAQLDQLYKSDTSCIFHLSALWPLLVCNPLVHSINHLQMTKCHFTKSLQLNAVWWNKKSVVTGVSRATLRRLVRVQTVHLHSKGDAGKVGKGEFREVKSPSRRGLQMKGEDSR